MEPNNCICCGHSLDNNSHGPDQNDYLMTDSGDYIHSGRCTYCKECNPVIKKILADKAR